MSFIVNRKAVAKGSLWYAGNQWLRACNDFRISEVAFLSVLSETFPRQLHGQIHECSGLHRIPATA